MKPIQSFKVITLVLTSVLFASMLATSSAVTIEPGKYGGTLVVAYLGEGSGINPALTSTGVNTFPGLVVFESLVWWPAPLSEPKPRLAESWEISENASVYTFHLVKNATWHDGVPFTSADVKFSIEKVLSQLHPTASTLLKTRLDRVDTPDNYTAVVRLKSPIAFLLYFLGATRGSGTIIPKHIYDYTNTSELLNNPYNNKPIGTGPFKFVKWEKGNYIEFERNPNYWKSGLPYLDKIIIKTSGDAASVLAGLETGALQGAGWPNIAITNYAELSNQPNLNATGAGELEGGQSRVWLNMRTNPILNNTLVRQAMSWAIDRKQIATTCYPGVGTAAWGPFRHDFTYFNPALIDKWFQNFTKANELLDAAGYPRQTDGTRFTLRLTHYSDIKTDEDQSKLLIDWWSRVGIRINYQPLDRATATAKVWNYDFDLFVCTSDNMPHPAVQMGRLYYSSRINMKGVSWHNVGAYNNSRVDWLLDQFFTETNTTKLRAYGYEFQDIVNRDLPIIDLVDAFYPKVWSAEYHNYGLSAGWAGGEGMYEYVYSTKGQAVSSDSALAAIQKAHKDLDNLAGQYYDTSAAEKRLQEAQTAYDAGQWANAYSLASTAADLANPPYLMYAIIAIVIVAIVIIAWLYWRRRKKKQ